MPGRIVAFIVLSLCLSFLWWLDTPLIRYSNVGHNIGCVANQMINMPPSVDFLALGSSRIREGIDPEEMIRHAGSRLKTAFNVGESGLDIARSHTIVKDLLDRGVVLGVVFVEMDLDAVGGIRPYRGKLNISYPGFMRYGEILDVASVMPDSVSAFAVASRLFVGKVKFGLGLLMGGGLRESLVALSRPPSLSCMKKDLAFSSEKREKRKERKLRQLQEIFGDPAAVEDDRFSYVDTPSSRLEFAYLEKLRRLAREHGFRLLVGRHWGYADPPLSVAAVERIQTQVPEFVYPGAWFVRQHSEDFVDASHMRKNSRDAYSRWLTDIVVGN